MCAQRGENISTIASSCKNSVRLPSLALYFNTHPSFFFSLLSSLYSPFYSLSIIPLYSTVIQPYYPASLSLSLSISHTHQSHSSQTNNVTAPKSYKAGNLRARLATNHSLQEAVPAGTFIVLLLYFSCSVSSQAERVCSPLLQRIHRN